MKRGNREWWAAILEDLSDLLLASPSYAYLLEAGLVPQSKAGFKLVAAREDEIADLEVRIGRRLPWSYRELLSASNGFPWLTNTIGRLLRASEVDLYQQRDPEIVRTAMEDWDMSWVDLARHLEYDATTGRAPVMDYRGDHLSRVVEVTEEYDGLTILLDPLIQDPSGEWEAWYFGPGRIQGAFRYASLTDLVEDRFRRMRVEGAG